MKLRFLPIAVLSALLSVSAAQQTSTTSTQTSVPAKGLISGRVLRSGSGEALRKALVTLRPVGGGQRGQQGQGQPGQQAQQFGQRGQPPGGGARSVVTEEDGAFAFPDLDAGQYRVSVERAGFIDQEYGQRVWNGAGAPITLESGQKLAGLTIQLTPAGTIVGIIRDDRGEPLAGVQVRALTYTYQQGARTLASSEQTQTNDVGEYRLYWLTPGDYYISAVPGPEQLRLTPGGQRGPGGRGGGPQGGTTLVSASNESYAPTYFPGITEPESAIPVTLAPAMEIRGIDFALRGVPTVKVKGRVTSPEAIPQIQDAFAGGGRGGRGERGQAGQRGQPGIPTLPGGGVQVLLSRIGPGANVGGRGGPGGQGGPGGPGGGGPGGGRGGRGGAALEQAAGIVNPDGTFEIANVIPGSYNLTAIQQSQGRLLSGRTRVDVGNSGVDFVGVDLRYGASISGQIQTEGQASAQFRMNNLRVTLTPADSLPFGNAEALVDEEGKFTLDNIGAMTYRIGVGGLGNGSYLASARYGSGNPLNDLLEVSGEGSRLTLDIGFSPGQIAGAATDKAGQPFQAATCVLIPSVRNRTDLYRTATSDQEGRFSFANVAPGDYKVLAWESIPSGAYMDPAFLKNFEDRARTMTVGKGESMSIQVQVIVE